MTVIHDGRLHRLALHRASEREISERMARWRRRRAWRAPLLWAVAALAAGLTWLARRAR